MKVRITECFAGVLPEGVEIKPEWVDEEGFAKVSYQGSSMVMFPEEYEIVEE